MGGIIIPDFHDIIETQVQNTTYNNYFPAADWIDQPEVQANIAEYNYYNPPYGYTDINISQSLYGPIGITMGVQIDHNDNIHLYVGPGLMNPGTGFSVQTCVDAPSSSGVYFGVQGTLPPLISGQVGMQFDNHLHPGFTEVGDGLIPGVSATVVYVSDPWISYHDLLPSY